MLNIGADVIRLRGPATRARGNIAAALAVDRELVYIGEQSFLRASSELPPSCPELPQSLHKASQSFPEVPSKLPRNSRSSLELLRASPKLPQVLFPKASPKLPQSKQLPPNCQIPKELSNGIQYRKILPADRQLTNR